MSGSTADPPAPRLDGQRVVVAFDRLAHHALVRHAPAHPRAARIAEAPDLGEAPLVRDALESLGARVRLLPLDRETALRQLADLQQTPPDLVFNLCDTLGARGELALLVTGALETAGIPFTGAGSMGLALSKRKHDVKTALVRAGLPTPRYQVVATLEAAAALELVLEPPVIVKPAGEHASIGIDAGSVCWDASETRARCVSLLTRFGQAALVEEYVGGQEAYVTLVGDPARPLALMEMAFDELPEGYLPVRTFDQKWFADPACGGDAPIDRDRRTAVPLRRPAVPFDGTFEDVPLLCRRAFAAGGGRDWGRVDLRLDAGDVPLIIDVTPNSYLGQSSPCTLAAAASGLSYRQLVAEIAWAASRRAHG
ncbi:MAG: D-alanine--D-alanine ligase family protein [Myxococcales bacterium]